MFGAKLVLWILLGIGAAGYLAYRSQGSNMVEDRAAVAARYEKHVDRLLRRLPAIVEGALRREKFDWAGRIVVERVGRGDFWHIECGYAEARPGSYAEYLCRRLADIGLHPCCTIQPVGAGAGPRLVVIPRPEVIVPGASS